MWICNVHNFSHLDNFTALSFIFKTDSKKLFSILPSDTGLSSFG